MRPTYVFAAAFVGLVGSAVIAATTLFIGYKSVEVVSNDTITTAEASIPIEDPIDGSQDFMPMVNANEGFDDDGTGQSLLLAYEDAVDADLDAKLAPASSSPAPVMPVGSEVSEDGDRIAATGVTGRCDQRCPAGPFAPTAAARAWPKWRL